MRRGQAEMIGLILIVLLLAAGFLLYIRFSVKAPEESIKARYEQTQMGQTFVTSLAKTQLACGGLTMTVANWFARGP